MSEFNRRKFLTDSTILAGGALLSGCTALGSRNLASVIEDNKFHFIVIGSGAGGGPLASRLAEWGFKVLLLEAGGDTNSALESIPVNHAKASENPDTSWKFFVNHYEHPENQKKDSKFIKQKGIFYPRASNLGGSTVMNAMITMYPDLNAMLEGVKIARRINSNLFMKGLIDTEIVPSQKMKNDLDVKNFIMNESWGHHASCTNPIGAANDPMAVLDSQFRVKGVKGLRVVDASVFPKIPGMFIALPIYMISEKAADVLRYEYKSQL